VALQGLERFDEALASYERALAIRPNYAEAHNNRGVVLQEIERFDEALASYERALSIKPNYAEALTNRGIALRELTRFDEALASYEQALAIQPNYAEAYNNRGITLWVLKRLDDALANYERALAIKPDYAEALQNQGLVLHELGRSDEALVSYQRALTIKPNYADAYRSQGATLHELKRPAEALASYERALALAPDAKYLHGTCQHARMQLCDWTDFDADLARLAAGIERGDCVASPFVVLSLFDSPSLQRKATATWVRQECSSQSKLPPTPRYPTHEKVRIGYFSADFCNHAVAALTAELFETHDRSRFDLTAFSLGPDVRDGLRLRLEPAFDRFLPVARRSDEEIAGLARSLEIDIAVDLGGFTQNGRPNIFAQRAAPIQVSYLGYLGTAAADFFDYLIADATLVPGDYRQYYAERIAYLPSYQANDSKRIVPQKVFTRAELGLPPTGFVFSCFNATYKITPAIFASWMRILTAVPNSVLFLLGGNVVAERNLRQQAADDGVAPARLVFGRRLAFGEYLARYRAADLFLDTLPYNAGTTASDALWVGLPVLTCLGEAFAGRMAASLLTAVGLPELITTDRADYERLAIELATNPEALARVRWKLADARSTAALFDTSVFTRNLEALYGRMYERHRSGLPPDHLCSQAESAIVLSS
jgi:predicted O-linked N-acetylglucosamine transferase (SPINDLY family)